MAIYTQPVPQFGLPLQQPSARDRLRPAELSVTIAAAVDGPDFFDGEQGRMGKLRFLELNADEIAELDRPANGVGGFQSFIRRLQSQVNHATATIKVTDDDVAEIQHYAFDFKQGGFQDRLMSIFGRVLGPKLGREE